MKIRGKTVFVYDIEVFPNLFTLAIKNSETKEKRFYEISERQNDLYKIACLFDYKGAIFCGFNCIHYDNCLIHYILMNYDNLITKPVWDLCKELKDISDQLIEVKDWKFTPLSKYKYANLFKTLDLLTLMFSSKLRVGLKELQVTMNFPNVKEFEGDFNANVKLSDIQNVKFYNYNDIDSTDELLTRLQKDIDLRLAIEDEYKIDALNKDGVNLGMEIIKQRYLAETGLSWKEIKDLRSPCDNLCLNDIIFDFIEFKTPTLKFILNELKSLCIDPNDNSFERQFYIGSVKHTLSLGGAHSVNVPEVFKLEADEVLEDVDVTLRHWRN